SNTDSLKVDRIHQLSFQPEKSKNKCTLVKRVKESVYWSRHEIRNLQRLVEFIDNVSQNIKDEVRVITSAKDTDVESNSEGIQDPAPIVMDLSFDGHRIYLTTNYENETFEYENIWVEERYNDHYNGIFTEYFVG